MGIGPENRPMMPWKKEIPIGSHHFLGVMLVSGSVYLPTFTINNSTT